MEKRGVSIDAARRRWLLAAAAGIACGAAPGCIAAAPARTIGVIGAPSNLGLRPLRTGHVPGAARAPQTWRTHGLVRRLRAVDCGDEAAPAYDPRRDAQTGYRNGRGLADYTPRLAQRIGSVLDGGRFALVLGGDCSTLLAGTLALKRRGRYGLLFIDGHSDYYEPEPSHIAAAAGTDFALVTGHGPAALADIDHLRPYVREEDAVAFAYRDYGSGADAQRFLRAGFRRLPLAQVRASGAAAAMREALAHLQRPVLQGFWIHLDLDVLDPALMPAVDSPDPGGLRYAELEDALAVALASPHAAGLELTIYDPDLDPGGEHAERLVAMLVRAFTRAGWSVL